MNVLWQYGQPWLDLKPALATGGVLLVDVTGAIHRLSPGERHQVGPDRPLPSDALALPWDRITSSGPCGVTCWWRTCFHAGLPIVLACSDPSKRDEADIKERAREALSRLKDAGEWAVIDHPVTPCGALYCPTLEG